MCMFSHSITLVHSPVKPVYPCLIKQQCAINCDHPILLFPSSLKSTAIFLLILFYYMFHCLKIMQKEVWGSCLAENSLFSGENHGAGLACQKVDLPHALVWLFGARLSIGQGLSLLLTAKCMAKMRCKELKIMSSADALFCMICSKIYTGSHHACLLIIIAIPTPH